MEDEFERYLALVKQKARDEAAAYEAAKFTAQVNTVINLLRGFGLADDAIEEVKNALLNPVQSAQEDT